MPPPESRSSTPLANSGTIILHGQEGSSTTPPGQPRTPEGLQREERPLLQLDREGVADGQAAVIIFTRSSDSASAPEVSAGQLELLERLLEEQRQGLLGLLIGQSVEQQSLIEPQIEPLIERLRQGLLEQLREQPREAAEAAAVEARKAALAA